MVKCYGATTAVDGISFSVETGTLATLLGPSGCGKTTTLRLIAGLEVATAGRILIGGREVTQLPPSERNVSMVFQSYALFPHMTVIENVAYGPTVSGVPKRRAREMAAEKILLLGLSGLERRFPSELSGGQQQRVAVARARRNRWSCCSTNRCRTSTLNCAAACDDIRDLQSRLNLTVVYVTHDQQEALAISDQVIVMAQAAIAQSGRPRDLYENPANVFVADFIGDANIVDAELAACSDDRVQVRLAGLDITLPPRNMSPGPVKLAVRPEAIRLYRDKPAGPALPARLVKTVYLGSHMEYTVDCALGALFVIDRSTSQSYAISSELWIRFCHFGVTILSD